MNIDTAVAIVTPRHRHVQRFLMIEVSIQRTLIFIIVQTNLDTRIYIAYPNSILVFLYIPFPTEIIRAVTAFFA